MKFFVCIFVLFFIPCTVFTQWSDDFSDGEFTNYPPWLGNTNDFTVENGWLRLYAAAAGTSYLSVASDIITDASWEFVIKMDFNPSSSNYAKIYLTSDSEVLNAPLNGYFLRIGHTGRDICLFRQNGSVTKQLMASRINILNAPSSYVRVLVTRDLHGVWTLKTDLSGGHNFTVEGSAHDTQINCSAYFGIVCTYTSTRSSNFYFDDFLIDGQPYIDIESPTVTSCVVDGKTVRIGFSEPVTAISEPFSRFFNIDARIHLESAYTDDTQAIILTLTEEMNCGLRHHLTVRGIEDVHGNTMPDTTLCLSIPCHAAPYDIVISEIMANPSNPVFLPEYEYVELHNSSDKNIELGGWEFTYGNTVITLPEYLFPAGEYLLLVHHAAVTNLSGYGATLQVLGSLTAINNSGQYMQLRNNDGTVIYWVDFTTDWYADPLKANGGWSLEQINPKLTCSVASNWKASTSISGGTPGQENSVHAAVSLIQQPEIIRIATPDSNIVSLYLSNPLGNISPDVSQFVMTQKINSVKISGKHFDCLQLHLQSPLHEGEWYDLSVKGNITDCTGYTASAVNFRFALPQHVDNLDVVINEILFNPSDNGSAYAELYNRSQKAVRVSDMMFALRDGNGKLSTPAVFTDEPFLLLPGQYLVISRNIEAVMQQFDASAFRSAFLQTHGMPSLNRTEGRLVLLNKSLQVVDEVHYDSRQHVNFIQSGSGVALERIHPDRKSINDDGNWHTAAQTEKFGTPGRQNSQYMVSSETVQDEVIISSEVFSPDNDGMDDMLNINYHFNTPSMMGEVTIFDSSGRTVRRLVHRQLLPAEGTVAWDGTDNHGRRASTGVYIVFFHAFHPNGTQKVYKIPCVLTMSH